MQNASAAGKKNRTAARAMGWIAVTVAVAACSGSGGDNAPSCVGSMYSLGCVGDGRPDSPTTPGSLPTARCAKGAYTLFKVEMHTGSPRRIDIAGCQLEIQDASGNQVEEYILPAGGDLSSGTAYGCWPDQTPEFLGVLSYSICCANKGPLTFKLVATSSDGTIVQEGTGNAACSPFPPEVPVTIQTAPLN